MLPYLFEPHRPSPNSVLLLLPDMPPSPSRGKDSYPASSPGSQTSCSPHGPTPNEFPLSASLWHFSNNPPVGTRRYPTLSLLQSQPPRAPAASLCNLYVALHGMCCPPPGCECSGPVNCCQYHLFCPVSHIRSSLEPWGKTLSLPSRLREDEQNNSMSLFFFLLEANYFTILWRFLP